MVMGVRSEDFREGFMEEVPSVKVLNDWEISNVTTSRGQKAKIIVCSSPAGGGRMEGVKCRKDSGHNYGLVCDQLDMLNEWEEEDMGDARASGLDSWVNGGHTLSWACLVCNERRACKWRCHLKNSRDIPEVWEKSWQREKKEVSGKLINCNTSLNWQSAVHTQSLAYFFMLWPSSVFKRSNSEAGVQGLSRNSRLYLISSKSSLSWSGPDSIVKIIEMQG